MTAGALGGLRASGPYYAQKYLFPAYFFYHAAALAGRIHATDQVAAAAAALRAAGVFSAEFHATGQALFLNVAMLLFNAFTGVLLLTLGRPRRPPESLADVAVPLVSTFLPILFTLTQRGVRWLPAALTADLTPPALLVPALAISGGALVFGWCLALYAIWCLRRSFAVFVEVRDVVTHGPYRVVRHPMYLSYVFVIGGTLLANVSVAWVVLTALHFTVMVRRARLEESMLARADARYRQYMARTGFFFPRLRPVPVAAPEPVGASRPEHRP